MAIMSQSGIVRSIIFWLSAAFCMAAILSRRRAASSNSRSSAALSISAVSFSTDISEPFLMYSIACFTAVRYSSSEKFPVQTPMHRLMWKLRQGLCFFISLGKTRVQVGSLNTRFASSTACFTAKELVYGPMYSALSSLFCNTACMRGYGSSVTRM